jgi:hypothetical protein
VERALKQYVHKIYEWNLRPNSTLHHLRWEEVIVIVGFTYTSQSFSTTLHIHDAIETDWNKNEKKEKKKKKISNEGRFLYR